MEIGTAGHKQAVLLADFDKIFSLLFRVFGMPYFNTVKTCFYQVIDEVEVVVKAGMRQDSYAAGLVDGLENIEGIRKSISE